jgi:bifunctional DNase/RNase
MKTLVESLGAHIERVDVTRIADGTFYAEITLVTPRGPLILDARPSDSVALAVRTEAPLFVADEVLEEAGIPAELVETVSVEEDALDEFKKFLDDVDPEDFQG